MRNLAYRWMTANPIARLSVYAVAGVSLGLIIWMGF
jgi:hypothetical protein